MGVIKFITEQLENNVDNAKGIEYIIRVVNSLTRVIRHVWANHQPFIHLIHAMLKHTIFRIHEPVL